ncbi:MAG: sigma-70 family RNA polymerase sigma factor [Bacteroidetes bacterium]|nr:sigma-70 family RNA polymerase sigma factor [Bacteroidota bacterium]
MIANLLNIADIRQGDDRTWYEVYEHFEPVLSMIAIAILDNPEDAEEVISEALYEAWKRRTEYQTTTHLELSLRKITQHRSFNQLKRNKRRKAMFQSLDMQDPRNENVRDPGTHDSIPFEEAWKGLLQHIDEEIPRLPSGQQEIFRLRYFDKLTTSEISRKLAINVQTVRNQLLNARKSMAISLKNRGSMEVLTMLLSIGIFFSKFFPFFM